MEEVVIIGACRTGIGNYMGTLRDIPAYDLVAYVLDEVAKRAKIDPDEVDDCIFGQCYQSGEYVNVARHGLLKAGWPEHVSGITIDRRCPSGGDAVCFAAMEIMTGVSEIVACGGVESMSSAEFYIPGNIKWGIGRGAGIQFPDAARGHGSVSMAGIPIYDRIQRSRPMHMPIEKYGYVTSNMTWAENSAKEHGLTREQADAWAVRSHRRAVAAQDAGKFDEQIVPITIPQRKGDPIVFDKDEGPRRDTSVEKLAKLKPVLGGICTAGNSATENDAAAAYILTTPKKAKELGAEILGYVKCFAFGGTNPLTTWKGSPVALEKIFKKHNLTVNDFDLFEIQEAFAIQVLSDFIELGIDEEMREAKVNVNGSGIALGHPLGATLALRGVNLLFEMRRRDAHMGLFTTPGAGGTGTAVVIERK